MEYRIRRAGKADAGRMALVQTESWKTTFAGMIPAQVMAERTEIPEVEEMYQRLLGEEIFKGYILEIGGAAHCIACWSESRESDRPQEAEVICIHSRQEGRREGFGSRMMERILADIRKAGYDKVMLWVFEENAGAIAFYRKHGFVYGGKRKKAWGAWELLYEKELGD